MPTQFFTFALMALLQTTAPAPQSDSATFDIATRVADAAGAKVWPSVKRVAFTFNVHDNGKPVVTRRHDWNVRAHTGTVTVEGKTTAYDLNNPAQSPAAFQQWTNDTYWLLMPLKITDAGVNFTPATTTRDTPPSRANFTMRFNNVGLTPGDAYDLSVDLQTHRVTHWVYRPNATKAVGFTWENYQDFNGLALSTEHKTDDGKRRIFFTDVIIERD